MIALDVRWIVLLYNVEERQPKIVRWFGEPPRFYRNFNTLEGTRTFEQSGKVNNVYTFYEVGGAR